MGLSSPPEQLSPQRDLDACGMISREMMVEPQRAMGRAPQEEVSSCPWRWVSGTESPKDCCGFLKSLIPSFISSLTYRGRQRPEMEDKLLPAPIAFSPRS